MIFLLLSSVICVCAAFRERSKGKHPLGLSAPRGGRKKTEHAEPCPTCPEEMIAGLRVLSGGIPCAQTALPRNHRRGRSPAIKRTGPRSLSPHAFAPWDILFFGPKNKTCVFTGRSSDSASSPRPLLGLAINGHGLDSTSQQRSCRRLALRSLFSLSPAWSQRADERAPVNTRVFCCAFSIAFPSRSFNTLTPFSHTTE